MDFRAFFVVDFWGRGRRNFYEKSSFFEKVLTNANLSYIIKIVERKKYLSFMGILKYVRLAFLGTLWVLFFIFFVKKC